MPAAGRTYRTRVLPVPVGSIVWLRVPVGKNQSHLVSQIAQAPVAMNKLIFACQVDYPSCIHGQIELPDWPSYFWLPSVGPLESPLLGSEREPRSNRARLS